MLRHMTPKLRRRAPKLLCRKRRPALRVAVLACSRSQQGFCLDEHREVHWWWSSLRWPGRWSVWEEIDGTKQESGKKPKEKKASRVCTVGINRVAYALTKLAYNLTELLYCVNKLPAVLSILHSTLIKLPTICFVGIFVDNFHHVLQSFSLIVMIIVFNIA
jgi:hypothetical protein